MPLTPEDLAAIGGLIDNKLEASKTANVSAEDVGKIVADQLKGLKLDEKITAAVDAAKPKGKTGEGEGESEKNKGESSAEYDARMKALEEKQAAAEARERSAIAREREERLRGELGRALEAQGIPRDRHDQAIAYLRTKTSAHSGKPIFDFDDTNGAPIFRKAGKGFDDSVTIEAGIKDWASSEEAKLYKPPADRRGTGTGEGRGRGASSSGNETSVNEILARIEL